MSVWIMTAVLPVFLFTLFRQDSYEARRERMVRTQIENRGIRSEMVLDAMRQVPRHLFVPPEYMHRAYDDRALPIGRGQTISQPYIVAFMTDQIDPGAGDKVLEIGTGSGYQAAVLAEIVREVYTIEIDTVLGKKARRRLLMMKYDNIETRVGDGYLGWPEAAPFDAIVVTAAISEIPPPLIDQLAVGGRMVIPVGSPSGIQYLKLVTKKKKGVKEEKLIPVRFVPFVTDKDD